MKNTILLKYLRFEYIFQNKKVDTIQKFECCVIKEALRIHIAVVNLKYVKQSV